MPATIVATTQPRDGGVHRSAIDGTPSVSRCAAGQGRPVRRTRARQSRSPERGRPSRGGGGGGGGEGRRGGGGWMGRGRGLAAPVPGRQDGGHGHPRRGARRRRHRRPAVESRQGVLPRLGADGGTKRHLVEYYRTIATLEGAPLVRALLNRPTYLQRFPDGIEGEEVYQKRLPPKVPEHVQSCRVTFPSGRHADALKVTNPADVVWAANLGTVTFHPWHATCSTWSIPISSDRPRPPARDRFRDAAGVAADVVRPLLAELGYPGYPKTSGGRGCTSSSPSSRAGRSPRCAGPRSPSPGDRAPFRGRVTPPGGRSNAASRSLSTTTRTPGTARSPRPTPPAARRKRPSPLR